MSLDDSERNSRNAITTATFVPGSLPLRKRIHESFCRYRAEGLPSIEAYRKAQRYGVLGRVTVSSHKDADRSSDRLEAKREIAERIQYLSQDVVGTIAAKRARLEERLWSQHEADIGDFVETIEIDGKTIERPKRLTDIPPELRKNIEKISISASGRLVPQLYSKQVASQELRKMLSIGRNDDGNQIQRLSDAELVAQLAEQAKQLGVDINLNYSFVEHATGQAPSEDSTQHARDTLGIDEKDQ